jgi:hypothetical protein
LKKLLELNMADKKQRPILQRLCDLLKTRIDVRALLQELCVERAADVPKPRRTFGYAPAVLGSASRTGVQARARLLFIPVREPKSPKAG